MKIRYGLVLAIAIVLGVTGCASGGGGATGDGDVLRGVDVEVLIFDNRFEYTEIRIPVGGSVNWPTSGTNPHNAVDANGSWSTEDVFGSLEQLEGDSAVITYLQAGVYTFFCTFHGSKDGAGMSGRLVVEVGN